MSLIITRREGEEVVIGDPAKPYGTVTISSIKGDRVRLAFDFPRTEVNEQQPIYTIDGGLVDDSFEDYIGLENLNINVSWSE